MRLLGLTGGIASGKSTIAQMLREDGVPVIDADLLAREVVEPWGPAIDRIRARWPDCVGPDGRLDRARLGAHVFDRPEELAALEAIVHPLIEAEARRRADALAREGRPLAFYEAALIFEKELERGLDGVLLAAVSPEIQLARVQARDGLSEADARKRLAAQLPLEEKLRRARYVVWTDGPIEQTRGRVLDLLRTLRRPESPAHPEEPK